MTDKELLEAAAKAAGIEGEYRTERMCIGGDWQDVTAIFLPDDDGWWNPLTDDGDAFRLACGLDLFFDDSSEQLQLGYVGNGLSLGEATRRAFTAEAANRHHAAAQVAPTPHQ